MLILRVRCNARVRWTNGRAGCCPPPPGPLPPVAVLCGFVAFLSAFMNNIGALALLMPAAVQAAGRLGIPPGRLLMPLSFSSLLGGMTTLIGTPPNLVVAGFRAEATGAPFGMFDFSLVGIPVALGRGGVRLPPRLAAGAAA